MVINNRCESILEVPHHSRISWCKGKKEWDIIQSLSSRGHIVICRIGV